MFDINRPLAAHMLRKTQTIVQRPAEADVLSVDAARTLVNSWAQAYPKVAAYYDNADADGTRTTVERYSVDKPGDSKR